MKYQYGSSLLFFRRLLQMGVYNSELYNNLGLCCFYAQQYDMTLTCFERALALATDETLGDVWYNVGHVALVCIVAFCRVLSVLSDAKRLLCGVVS